MHQHWVTAKIDVNDKIVEWYLKLDLFLNTNLHWRQWVTEQGLQNRDVMFSSKVGQIGPKLDKSVTFPDQISEHFGAVRQNVLKSDRKKSRICPIWGQSDPLWT